MASENKKTESLRLKVVVQGAVQGVGFRPFVFKLATELGLTGWVLNSTEGVFIEVEGDKTVLDTFLLRLQQEAPPQSRIWSLESVFLPAVGYDTFEIRHSEGDGAKTTTVLPEIATCADCLREINDPDDRHYRYPFTNCTNCGPRFTIIRQLPYDRQNTSMAAFEMCQACQTEYDDPTDRRFHAQPTACPKCGPQLVLWDEEGNTLAEKDDALSQAVQAIRDGKIVAMKGLGGFLLLTDARNDAAVKRLRERKLREEKPFALLFPSFKQIQEYCEISELEERLLKSPECPIVLLKKKDVTGLSQDIAPNNPFLGVMLPYSPLHHLLMQELRFPVIATSGNKTDEPIAIDETEALVRLKGIADLYLVHDRLILRHSDDSIVRIMNGRELVTRRARGYAPLPVYIKDTLPPLLAVGAHLKNTVAISVGNRVIISQHIGDLETPQSFQAFKDAVKDLQSFYELEPVAVACDMHPYYISSKYAHSMGLPVIEVQHHHAHLASVLAENQLDGPALGLCWDGTGYGTDGTLWGGEFLLGGYTDFQRVAHFLPLPLPGGEQAIRQPRRVALSLLYIMFGDEAIAHTDLPCISSFSKAESSALLQMLQKGLNTPASCGVGRLFDAVASLIDLRQYASFEGQPAMELEWIAAENETSRYEFGIIEGDPMVVDWRPVITEILDDLRKNISQSVISARFHNGLIALTARMLGKLNIDKVALSGGVFQNRILTEGIYRRLSDEGFEVYSHQRVSPNDGGISLGQIMVAAAKLNDKQVEKCV